MRTSKTKLLEIWNSNTEDRPTGSARLMTKVEKNKRNRAKAERKK